jgi:CheY-like chemotaxis protein
VISRRARILTVDNDEKSREIIQLLAQNQGYETLEAASGETALDLIRSELPDLILLDVKMEGISSFEIVKQLKQNNQTRPIPVIMVTALEIESPRLRALENRAEDYLMKPVDPAERISHFTSALARAMGKDPGFVESIFYASTMHDARGVRKSGL